MVQESNPLVIVWRINLSHLDPDQSFYYRFLDDEEIVKSKRFYFEKDQKRYVQSHAILRLILRDMLDQSPRSIQFITNSYGKPYLSNRSGGREVFFNISHSQSGLLIAVSESIECGVDIEFQRDDFPSTEIAEHFFSKNEFQAYSALPEDQRIEAFFNCWTRKEAFIKAKGMGLSIPLGSFDVTLVPGEAARLIHSSLDPDDMNKWSLMNLDSWSNYSAALCSHSLIFDLTIKDWA